MIQPLAKDTDATIEPDAPIFDGDAFRLTDQEIDLTGRARHLGQSVIAGRAEKWDRDAIFPTENYKDMHEHGLLGICVPKDHGGEGATFRAYCLSAAEIGRYCGTTALTWNMHVCSCLWTGALADDLDMSDEQRARHEAGRVLHYDRIVKDGAVYSQPFSEGSAAAAGFQPFSTQARKVDGGYKVTGRKIFASLAGHADYYGVLCTLMHDDREPSRRDTLYLSIPADADGVQVVGGWDSLGMRGTVSRTLLFDDVMVDDDAELMPQGVYFLAASSWPHMFMTLSPTYMGIAQAAYDFHREVSARRSAGHAAGQTADVSDQADRGRGNADQARGRQGAMVPGDFRSVLQPDQGAGACAPMPRLHGDGNRERPLPPGDPDLRRPSPCSSPCRLSACTETTAAAP